MSSPHQTDVAQIAELLNAQATDERKGGNPSTDEPQTASDIVGDIAGGSENPDVSDPVAMEGKAQGGQENDAAVDSGEAGESGDAGEPGDEPAPVTVSDLAEQLGVDAKTLYEELEIPTGEGESITLGQFKDRVKELTTLDAERESVQTRASEVERQHLAQQAEMQQLISMIPAEMRENLLREAGNRHKSYVKQQERTVLETIPAWQDADARAKDRDAIIAMGAEYGFSEQEMSYTHDARTLKMVHDHLRLRERLQNVDLESKREPKKPPGKPLGKPGKRNSGTLRAAIQKAKASGDVRDQQSAVSALIRSQ